MAFGGFDALIGQTDAKRAALEALEDARQSGDAPAVLVSGRKGIGKTAFIQAMALEWSWDARYAAARELVKVDDFGDFVYSSIDRAGRFRCELLTADEPPARIEGDRSLVIDDLQHLGKRAKDALTRLMADSAISVGKIVYPLPYKAAIFAAHESGADLDERIAALFRRRVDLCEYEEAELAALAAEFMEARLAGDYDVDAIAMAICPPRNAPGYIADIMARADDDLAARGLRGGDKVDGRRMEDALARIGMTAYGVSLDEYFYLAALESIGGEGGVGAVAKLMGGLNDGFREIEDGMARFGLVEKRRRGRRITDFGRERFRRCEARRLL